MSRPLVLAACFALATPALFAASGYLSKGCPPAQMISQSYTTVLGQVVAVESGDRIVVQTPEDRRTVNLMGIKAPAAGEPLARDSREHLAHLLRGKKVELWYISLNSARTSRTDGAAVIHLPKSFKDVGLDQVVRGFARREDFGPYSQDARDECVYRNAEERAKAKHLGVWAR